MNTLDSVVSDTATSLSKSVLSKTHHGLATNGVSRFGLKFLSWVIVALAAHFLHSLGILGLHVVPEVGQKAGSIFQQNSQTLIINSRPGSRDFGSAFTSTALDSNSFIIILGLNFISVGITQLEFIILVDQLNLVG